MWGLELPGLGLGFYDKVSVSSRNLSQVSVSEVAVSTTSLHCFDQVRLKAEVGGSAVARVSEAPPEISRGAPHTLLAYYYELQ